MSCAEQVAAVQRVMESATSAGVTVDMPIARRPRREGRNCGVFMLLKEGNSPHTLYLPCINEKHEYKISQQPHNASQLPSPILTSIRAMRAGPGLLKGYTGDISAPDSSSLNSESNDMRLSYLAIISK